MGFTRARQAPNSPPTAGPQSASKKILSLPHAIRQMSKPDRMITTSDIRAVIYTGEIIEDYVDSIQEIIRAVEDRTKNLIVAA